MLENDIAIIQNRMYSLLDPFCCYENIFECFREKTPFLYIEIFYFRVLRKLKVINEIPSSIFWNHTWKKKVKYYNYWILYYSKKDSDRIAEYIKKKNISAKILYYSCDVNFIIDKNNFADAIAYFDNKLAVKENASYLHQFYNTKKFYPVQPVIYNYCWIGKVKKNRELDLLKIKKLVSGIENGYWKDIFDDPIDYSSQYLKIVQQSKCIIEVNVEGQLGLTLRALESLFYNKKLITNNIDIKSYDFYNKNNIFIINYDVDFEKWLKKDYEPVSDKIKQNYSFDSFLYKSKLILDGNAKNLFWDKI